MFFLKYLRDHADKYFLAIIILCTLALRFINLGYSNYCTDEPGSFLFKGGDPEGETVFDFLMRQRKGPMQVAVSHIPYLFTGDFRNELAQRIPYALFSTGSVIFFYLWLKKITTSSFIAFTASAMFSFNGFMTGFGRVAQYQSLNLFFSVSAAYFYSSLLFEKENKKLVKTLIGTFLFCLSFLSHWDAIYFIPFIGAALAVYLLNKNHSRGEKLKIVIFNFVFALLLLSPFMIPYLKNYMQNESNQAYFSERMDFTFTPDFERDIERIILYNPFLTVWLYAFFGFLGLVYELLSKKRKVESKPARMFFSGWTLFMIFVFIYVVGYPGTHLYNVLIPLIILSALGMKLAVDVFPQKFKFLSYTIIYVLLGFLFVQSYMVYVDHKNEYPWEPENILGFKTRKYTHEDLVVQRNLLGFPYFRAWDEVNDFINEQNMQRGENLTFVTNDNLAIAKFYMETPHSQSALPYYAIGIKDPYTFVKDYKFPQIRGKSTIHQIRIGDENKVRIYLVEGK